MRKIVWRPLATWIAMHFGEPQHLLLRMAPYLFTKSLIFHELFDRKYSKCSKNTNTFNLYNLSIKHLLLFLILGMRKLRHSKVNYLVQSDKTSKWDRNYSIVNFPELSIILNNWRGKKKKKTPPQFWQTNQEKATCPSC